MMKKVKALHENLKKISKKSFFRDFLVLSFIVAAIMLLGVLFLIIFLGVAPSEVLVQLRYDSFSGVSKVGSWYHAYNILVVGAVIFLANLFLSYMLYEKEKLAAVFILITSLAVEIILIVETINLVRLINI